jgi:surfeit locus 1 family protein
VQERHDWSFARRPRWVVAHFLAALLVATCVVAGLWQWSRHLEVSRRNDRIEARQEAPPLDEAALRAGPGPGGADPVWHLANLGGRYDVDGQVTIANRSMDGAPGCHVVTPLVLDGGDAILVNRGFLPLADCEEDGARAVAPPATSAVAVTGMVRASQQKGFFGASDPEDGTLLVLHRVDVPRIAQQYDRDLLDVYLELRSQTPDPPRPPLLLPPPELGAGPHLGYTGQWLLFAIVGLVGYPLVLRRQARTGAATR